MRRALIALLGLVPLSVVWAQPQFVASEIPLGEWPDELFFEDMDGDGHRDLIVPRWSLDAGRELAIYLQDSESRFPASPSRLVEIKPEIVAIAIADDNNRIKRKTSTTLDNLGNTIDVDDFFF